MLIFYGTSRLSLHFATHREDLHHYTSWHDESPYLCPWPPLYLAEGIRMGSSSLSSESWLFREGWVEPWPPVPAVSLLLQSSEPAAWSSSEGRGALGRGVSSVDRPSAGAAGGVLFWELIEGFSLPLSAVCAPSGVGWFSEGGLDPG